jgi:hypothetical protein
LAARRAEIDAGEPIGDEDQYLGQGDRDAVAINAMTLNADFRALLGPGEEPVHEYAEDRLPLPGTVEVIANERRGEFDLWGDGHRTLTVNNSDSHGNPDFLPLPETTVVLVNERRQEAERDLFEPPEMLD